MGGEPELALLTPEAGRGVARLPPPTTADVFFDIEGFPYWTSDPEGDPGELPRQLTDAGRARRTLSLTIKPS